MWATSVWIRIYVVSSISAFLTGSSHGFIQRMAFSKSNTVYWVAFHKRAADIGRIEGGVGMISKPSLCKVLRASRTPIFAVRHSPVRLWWSLIAANATGEGGDIVFQDTKDDWERTLRHMRKLG